ncbi:M4 family metallopeptidase [Roseateles sp.]|uniref:M4 family metallopeptidase n=1 Tax=Roseateles sp. TaxID=1971397 RepID=UPI003BA89F7E
MTRNHLRLSLLALSVGMAFTAQAQTALPGQSEALARLNAQTGNAATVSYSEATGAARFVRIARGDTKLSAVQSRAGRLGSDAARNENAVQFLKDYSGLFGITSVADELSASRVTKDQQGGSHLSYKQLYRGLPVYGGELKVHYDSADNLVVANGIFVPNISVSTTPARSAEQAAAAALKRVYADLGRTTKLSTKSTLMVYREGLAQGVPGESRLAWEVVATNGADVRDFVYVDAQTGNVIDKVSGIHEGKDRRAFDGAGNATAPGPNYPNNPFWVEGQPVPTGTVEADNMIIASSEVYDLFKKAFGRDSFDGNGARMSSIFNRGWGCVNASWNGEYISFCPGTTTDDITAHEWGHAYTQYTHGLIYAWQPGALNEAYSDIWGETVDRINGRGTDTPDAPRTAGACTVFTSAPPTVTVTAPASLAGDKAAGTAAWGPTTFSLSGTVQGVELGSTSAACTTLPANSLAGKIAFIDRGTCGFSVKAMNAQAAGAVGVIIGNNQGGTAVINMSDTAGQSSTLPSLSVTQNDGTAFKAALASGAVTVTLSRGPGTDNSVRWLLGEDSSAFGGAIRDMYNPTCYNNPGKVSDRQYSCGPNTQAGDYGGVHTNSGVPNHGYALLVDGGTYNGQTVGAIGLTKAAHIYFRAMSVYQHSASNFTDHADALDQSCRDLTGVNLNSLTTGAPSGEIINATDCGQITKMAAAVELRSSVSQCGFTPLLQKSPPALCPTGTATSLLSDSFDGGKRAGAKWALSHQGVSPEYTARDWGVVNNLPNGRAGYAMFMANSSIGTCSAGGDESGVQRLESPEITLPAGTAVTRMSFDHWVGTEASYDGGNVKISVNGGAWQLVSAANFVYNPYNATLATAAAGNTNPLAGQAAFSGSDGGSVSGSWGRSIINVGAYANPGDKIKVRFEMGQDGCGGSFGWYVDDVVVYRCTP